MLARFWRVADLSTALAIVFLFGAAQAQSGWTEYYYNSGVNAHFYYLPSSIKKFGSVVQVKWHDSRLKNNEKLVFLVELNCSGRTIQNLSVDRFNVQTGSFIATVDLRGHGSPTSITPATMADHLAQRAC